MSEWGSVGGGNVGGEGDDEDDPSSHQNLLPVDSTPLDNPAGGTNHVWRLDWSVTGTVLAAAGDAGTVTLYKQDFGGRFKPVSEVNP